MTLAATFNPLNWFRTAPASVPAVRPVSDRQNAAMIRARFDNQFTTDDNRQLWALADLMSVDAAANYMVRRTLRMRARYAYHNNPFVMGTVNRQARYVIGDTGPKLHMATDDPDANKQVETAFARWAQRVDLARKLRTRYAARVYNGEGFNLLRTNPKIRHPVKLDLFEVEADQVTSSLFGMIPSQYPDQWFDGVSLDPWGNKETYRVLRQHPGAFGAFLVMGYESDPWPAQYVLHDYSRSRPAQQRGVPELTPSLDIFEEARRYRKAVLAAAETAADYAGFITQPGAVGQDGVNAANNTYAPMDTVDIKRRMMTVLAEGQEAFQMKPEQPTQTYDPYLQSLLTEAAQILDMPLFIVTGDARLANMSSAYVSMDGFKRRVDCDRQEESVLMDQVFDEWLLEARLIPGLIPANVPDDPPHDWRWPRVSSHADPQKMAAAQNQRLKNGSSPSLEFAMEGLDFEEVAARAAADYGVPIDEWKAAYFQGVFAERGNPPPAATEPGTGDAPEKPEADEQ